MVTVYHIQVARERRFLTRTGAAFSAGNLPNAKPGHSTSAWDARAHRAPTQRVLKSLTKGDFKKARLYAIIVSSVITNCTRANRDTAFLHHRDRAEPSTFFRTPHPPNFACNSSNLACNSSSVSLEPLSSIRRAHALPALTL